ncbi:MAG: hypothetical protein EU517_00730 [Promethearchaeota archaeon]|nr:MAG: hypothetical protein EU517_00730 [Candidatus Lokiarchaeota archaeon]
MTTMYCERCQCSVLTKREDLDVGIIIILLIFTAGLGLLIYIAIYYEKTPNLCIHCNSICKPVSGEYQRNREQSPTEENVKKRQNYISLNNGSGESNFCYNCGTKLDDRERRFCPFCGVNVE